MKSIATKNYVIVSVVCILTIIIVSYFAYWYSVKDSYKVEEQTMSGFLLEFGPDEIINNIENYVLDNPECVIYISYGKDEITQDFEKELKNFIEQKKIKSSFVYIDLDNIKNKKFLSEFSEKFFSQSLKSKNIKLIKQSNLFVFKNGKVSDMLYYSKQSININDIHLFLIKQEVYIDD